MCRNPRIGFGTLHKALPHQRLRQLCFPMRLRHCFFISLVHWRSSDKIFVRKTRPLRVPELRRRNTPFDQQRGVHNIRCNNGRTVRVSECDICGVDWMHCCNDDRVLLQKIHIVESNTAILSTNSTNKSRSKRLYQHRSTLIISIYKSSDKWDEFSSCQNNYVSTLSYRPQIVWLGSTFHWYSWLGSRNIRVRERSPPTVVMGTIIHHHWWALINDLMVDKWTETLPGTCQNDKLMF